MSSRSLLLTVCAALLSAAPAAAQISFSSGELFPYTPGETTSFSVSSTGSSVSGTDRGRIDALIALRGANRTWDFTRLSFDESSTSSTAYYDSPAGLPGAAEFPSANAVLRTRGAGPESYTYGTLTGGAYTVLGTFYKNGAASGQDSVQVFSPDGLVRATFPYTSGTSVSDRASLVVRPSPGVDPTVEQDVRVVGHGTLVLPTGSYACLMESQTVTTTVVVDGETYAATATTYSWTTKERVVATATNYEIPGGGRAYSARYSVPPNRAPSTGGPVAATAVSGQPVSVDVLARASDPDGDRVTVTSTSSPARGTATVASGGARVTYTSDAGYAGSDSFTYTVSDGRGRTATGTVTVTVTAPPNRAPSAGAAVAATVTSGESVVVAVLAGASDPDGDALSVSAASAPRHGTAAVVDGGARVRYTPAAHYVGSDAFTYRVSDGRGGTATGTVNVTVEARPNRAPSAGRAVTVTVTSGQSSAVDVLGGASDPDGDDLSVSAVSDPRHGTASVTGGGAAVRYAADAGYAGSDAFTYTVSDGRGGTATGTVTVTVTAPPNRAPDAGPMVTVTATSGSPIDIYVLTGASDPDGDALAVSGAADPPRGTATVANGGSYVRYTPDAGYVGTDGFTYSISDGRGGVDYGTVRVAVQAPPNRAPSAGAAVRATVTSGESVEVAVLAGASDPDGDDLSVTAVAVPAHGEATITGGGTRVRYAADAGYAGSDAFAYTVSDGRGGTATGTVTVTVTAPPNRAPVVSKTIKATVTSGESVEVAVLTGASDPDGDDLVVSATSTPAHGTAAITRTGGILYTPGTGYTGSDAFTYTVSDRRGGTATGTVNVTVEAQPNRVPVAGDPVAATAVSGQPVRVDVLVGASDPDGDKVAVSAVSRPARGTAAVSGGGAAVEYVSTAGYVGADAFTYTVSDGRGGTATGTVNVTVTPRPNRAPAAGAAVEARTRTGESVEVAVLAGASDPDGDDLVVSATSTPAHGSAVVVGGSAVRYASNAGYVGSDSFTYTVSDGRGGTATGTVSVTVEAQPSSAPPNTPPAVEPEIEVEADAEASAEIDLFAGVADADADDLTITALSDPAHGDVRSVGGGRVKYTPDTGYTGPDSFTYTVSDGKGGEASGTVRLMVRAATSAAAAPSALALVAAPNPSRGRTTLRLTTPTPLDVEVVVWDVLGREVARLWDGPVTAGTSSFALDGGALAPGTYVARVLTGTEALTVQLTVVR